MKNFTYDSTRVQAKFLSFTRSGFLRFAAMFACIFMFRASLSSQQLQMSGFVVFGANGTSSNGCTNPYNPGNAVILGSGTSTSGGDVGSLTLVSSSSNVNISGNVYSKGKVTLSSNNTVSGKITASNSTNASGTIVSVGSSANLGGNIDANGNIVVSGGTVSGKVTHPSGKTYSGPTPAGGNVTGTPTLPTLPALPPVTTFPAYGTTNITTTQTINPGSYQNMTLTGGKTLTLNGPGVYVFKSISNSGSTNNIVFNFQNTNTGNFYIYIASDVNMGMLSVSMTNGGSASRIYTETHGMGTTSSNSTYSFVIANGSGGGSHTKWLGTVWAPYACHQYRRNAVVPAI